MLRCRVRQQQRRTCRAKSVFWRSCVTELRRNNIGVGILSQIGCRVCVTLRDFCGRELGARKEAKKLHTSVNQSLKQCTSRKPVLRVDRRQMGESQRFEGAVFMKGV